QCERPRHDGGSRARLLRGGGRGRAEVGRSREHAVGLRVEVHRARAPFRGAVADHRDAPRRVLGTDAQRTLALPPAGHPPAPTPCSIPPSRFPETASIAVAECASPLNVKMRLVAGSYRTASSSGGTIVWPSTRSDLRSNIVTVLSAPDVAKP